MFYEHFLPAQKNRAIDEFCPVFFCSMVPRYEGKATDMKEETVTKNMKAVDVICSQMIVELNSNNFMIGEPGMTVEFDEVHLTEQKHVRGQNWRLNTSWCLARSRRKGLGGVQRRGIFKRPIKSENAEIGHQGQDVPDKAAKESKVARSPRGRKEDDQD